ncbi:LysR family transcriptional regulator [Ruegeria sp. HKCCA6837]|uniref:LysR family transcriptional regulator n=1 Tax=unclassified Ruegeria TaxID=2625375 RepID=UPI001488C42D|nr:LysR family transcriptional regulator [Ruegeria sp. HKCCD7296]NOD52585.1 LysR family transcriptional regulator [Ruegeria sp. HKCCD5851]NOD66004.1 LysR family transcriptional regulator [Ruegeria sp. HKCCD7303]NOE34378.1 LysR family transcriptional regulator [Ruegeria sp. HKCCD7318]
MVNFIVMNINQLKTLLAVIEQKSFAAAGEVIGLSPSAVSLQIKAMEDELGVQLFDRIKRPPVPTARGRALAEHAQQTLTLFEASARVARGEIVRSRLAIGAVPTALASFLTVGLKALQTTYPALQVEVKNGSSSALAQKLTDGHVDVAICTKPVNPIPGLDWHSIAIEPFVVVAPAHAKGDKWQDLLRTQPFIWFNRKTWAGQSIEEELRAQNIDVKSAMEIDSLDAISNLVSEGLGVSIVPLCKGRRPFSNRLRTLPFGDPPFSREIGAFTNSDGRADLVIDTFIGALQSS